jgi:small subunit ribosomal protein S3
MGQKVHPLGFRLGISQEHKSEWFAKPKQYAKFVAEDAFIRDIFSTRLQEAGVTDIRIERLADQFQVKVILFISHPRILIDANGKNTLSEILAELQTKIQSQVRLSVVRASATDAVAIANGITEQLEKRVAFRRALRQAVQGARRAKVRGIKVQISGRLNGAEIARSEWAREGRVPLHTLRAKIDYCSRTAQTTYGILGIKVWVYK